MAIGIRERIKEDNKPKSTRLFSDKQEKDIAKKVGGKQTSNSGATPWQKGDVLTSGEESQDGRLCRPECIRTGQAAR